MVIKKYIFCLVTFILCLTTTANTISLSLIFNQEPTDIYQIAFNYLVADRPSSQKIQIRKQTSLAVIKKFNFKHPNHHALDTTGFKINEPWGKFLVSVDTARLTNSSVEVNKIISPILSGNNDKPNAEITFSPTIISSNHALAICAYEYIDSFGNDIQGVLFLEKKTSKIWHICKLFKISAT